MRVIISVSNLLAVINSTMNFFVFVWRGIEFRRALKQKTECWRGNAEEATTEFVELSRNQTLHTIRRAMSRPAIYQ